MKTKHGALAMFQAGLMMEGSKVVATEYDQEKCKFTCPPSIILGFLLRHCQVQ